MRFVIVALLLAACVRKEPSNRERLDELDRRTELILGRIEELKLDARRYGALDDCLGRKFDGPEGPVGSEAGARMAVTTCRMVARHVR